MSFLPSITKLAARSVQRPSYAITRTVSPATTTLLTSLQTSKRWYASSPTPNSFPQLPPGFEKLAHSPSAMSAITTLIETMKEHGVDLQSGEKPSMWQMIKLAKNQEVRDATTKVMEELKNAGIDVSPERLQSIMNSQQDLFKKTDGEDK